MNNYSSIIQQKQHWEHSWYSIFQITCKSLFFKYKTKLSRFRFPKNQIEQFSSWKIYEHIPITKNPYTPRETCLDMQMWWNSAWSIASIILKEMKIWNKGEKGDTTISSDNLPTFYTKILMSVRYCIMWKIKSGIFFFVFTVLSLTLFSLQLIELFL